MVASDPGGGPRRPGGLSSDPALIVLGGGPAQRHAIDAAARLGVSTVVCDHDPARGDVAVSSEDARGVAEVARGAAGLIAPGTDWPVRVAADVAAQLGIPHPLTPAVATLATDKLAQRAALAVAGVPQPAWSTDAPPGYPCVVKASDRQGQRGMTVVADPAGLPEAERRAGAASRSGRLLYERLVPGPEVTVNGFCLNGDHHVVMVSDRIHFADAFGVCEQHVDPAERTDGAAEAATAAVRALGIGGGPTYVQVVLGPDGPAVMEVAARLGGGHDSELARLVDGVDLAEAAVLAALGRPVEPAALRPHPRGAGVIRFLRAPEGRLVSAAGPPEATFYHPPGHEYGPLRVATDRAGYVLVTAATREEALDAARRSAGAVRFEMA
jgi:biotin carboxylase